MDTIFALATAPGRAGVAVVRISGPKATEICRLLAGDVPETRRASLRRLTFAGEVIDQALVLVFSEGESFTGEKVVEFQTHGSPAVISRLADVVSGVPGVRMAEAGEFSRRALENGRMSLSEIEGLGDLLSAETESQRRQAFRTFDGELGRRVERWRGLLVRAAALVEACIDFADEEVPEDVSPEVSSLLSGLVGEFETELQGVGAAERLRSGFEVAIVGPPNSGKSTLLNRLAGRDAAITSEVAGTTRDVIEVRMDVGGIPVTFLDTAGVRDAVDEIEALGVERALARALAADIRIVLGEVDSRIALKAGDIVLRPKVDLLGETMGDGVSGLTGEGVPQLLENVETVLSDRIGATQVATHYRHAEALALAVSALGRAEESLLIGDVLEEVTAESIREAIRAMDSLVGRIGVEDVLGEVFSSFCIGK